MDKKFDMKWKLDFMPGSVGAQLLATISLKCRVARMPVHKIMEGI